LRLGAPRRRRAGPRPLDGALLAGVGRDGDEIARRVDARRPRPGAAADAASQAHLGGGGARGMTKLDHIGIAVKSIDAAKKIYEDLGLTIAHVESVETQKVRTAFLSVGDANLELLEPSSPDSTIAKYIEKRGEGIHHICFRVDDIEAHLAHLKERGYRLIDEA